MKQLAEITKDLKPEQIEQKPRSTQNSEQRETLLKESLRALVERNRIQPEQIKTWKHVLGSMETAEIYRAMDRLSDFTGFFNDGAFKELGRITPADLGLPLVESAYIEACNYQHQATRKPLSHPGMFWVIQQTGSHELKSQPRDRVFPRFKGFFNDMVEQVKNGKVFEIPDLPALEHKEPDTNYEPKSEGYKEFKRMVEEAKARRAHV